MAQSWQWGSQLKVLKNRMYPQKKYSANQESKEIRRQFKRLIKKEIRFSEQVVLNLKS